MADKGTRWQVMMILSRKSEAMVRLSRSGSSRALWGDEVHRRVGLPIHIDERAKPTMSCAEISATATVVVVLPTPD